MRDPRKADERIEVYAGPYERWVLSPELGLPYAFPAARRPSRIIGAILDGFGDPHQMGKDVRVPQLWSAREEASAAVPFVFKLHGPENDISDRATARRLSKPFAEGFKGRVRVNLPIVESSWPEIYDPGAQSKRWLAPAETPVAVVGVIDDALPFAHKAFLDKKQRTRISHIWLQSACAKDMDRVPFGKEIVNGEIDALRAEYGPDEQRLYRAAGAIDADVPEIGAVLAGRSSHGAHILGLAAGNAAAIDAAELDQSVQIVAVQLPNTVAWDTSGFGKEMFMLSALHYIFCCADEIARGSGVKGCLPLIVNLSYGWSAGRHDGQSVMEIAIEDLLRRRKALQPATAIVMPMGNHFDADMHAQLTQADFGKGTARIGWMLPPDDHTSSYLEVWLPEGINPKGWKLRVVPPKGARLDAGDQIAIAAKKMVGQPGDARRFVEMEIDGRIVGQLSVDLDRGSRWRVLIAVIPTAETGTGRRLPSGLWTIEIKQRKGAPLAQDQVIDLWVQRDDDPRPLGTFGRQSHLVGPQVTGFGAMSAIASAPSAIRVAGVVGTSTFPARYSGAGLVRDLDSKPKAGGVFPTLSAMSEQSDTVLGVRSIGCLSGSTSRLTGTSAAAALTTRWMAGNAAATRPLKDGLRTPNQKPAVIRKARTGVGYVP